MLKKIVLFGLGSALLAAPTFTFAQASTSAADQLTALLAQVKTLEALLTSAQNSVQTSPQNSTVAITDNIFTPQSITIQAGDTVTWTNNGSMAHTVTADDGSFDTTLQPGQTFSHTFASAGTVAYHCKFHGASGGIGMSGTVTVTAATSATTLSASPTSGPAPLAVSFSGTGLTSFGAYIINYGDGTNSGSIQAPECLDSAGCTVNINENHTYASAGTYTATLSPYIACLYSTPACTVPQQNLGTVTITVTGGNTGVLSAVPTSGPAPLSVNFSESLDSGTIDFGDGTSGTMQAAPVCGTCSPLYTAYHTYTTAGTYTVTFTRDHGIAMCPATNCPSNSYTVKIKVTSDIEGGGGTLTCPQLTSMLQKGDTDATTGGQVTQLQQFLTDYFNLPDNSLVAGTFGKKTEKYVKKFQTQNGIPPVGFVGKLTRAAIAAACTGGAGAATLTATPSHGAAPLPVDFSLNDPHQNQNYNINFGDGSTDSMVYTVGTDCSTDCSPRYDSLHTYQKDGVYTAAVTQVTNPCPQNTLCMAPARVIQIATTSVVVVSAQTVISVAPSKGPAPLAVTVSGNAGGVTGFGPVAVDFGDGSPQSTICQPGIACNTYTINHTYSSNGTYTVMLVAVGEGTNNTLGTATVTVGANSVSCLLLTHNLYLDVDDAHTGGDVTRLQNFLIAAGYLQDSATGFFGPVTQTAVQAYQSANGIASSGTPDTTGYGYIGPKTRAVMGKGCSPVTTNTPQLSVSPSSGAAPLTVTFTAINLVPGITYSVDTGDSSTVTLSAIGNSCQSGSSNCTMTGTHTYSGGGTFTAKLLKPGTSVTCTDINYDPNDPLSFLNLGTSPSCTSGSGTTVMSTATITVTATTITADCGTLASGASLASGQSLSSCNGRYTLTFQADGNVVLGSASNTMIWSTGTRGMGATIFLMQSDGNLVLYSKAPYVNENALWASGSIPPSGKSGGGTWGKPAKLTVDNTGNLVVSALSDNSTLWSSGTAQAN